MAKEKKPKDKAKQKTDHNDQRSANPNKTVKKQSKTMRFFLAAVLLLIMTPVAGFALLPGLPSIVHDPILTHAMTYLLGAELAQTIIQVEQQIETQRYWEMVHGNWNQPIKVVEVIKSTAAALGLPIKDLGWDKADKFSKNPSTQIISEALDELNKLTHKQNEQAEKAQTRENIERIYGDVPVTSAGAPVEFAYRTSGEMMNSQGQIDMAIVEALKNEKRMREDLESGELAPGDVERVHALIANEQYRIQTLQTKALNDISRGQAQNVLMQASNMGRNERNRIINTKTHLDLMANTVVSLEIPTVKEGEE